ncbi:GINS complex subunit [Entomophthora muscae]|uniref:GINS complex subunit n=1 Tax=Entomophthora muscae TaxID=34485 RepID=A0ACC2UUQ1_9FUNG|nr:GINS complex subunit [Entomophthora muscae]
MASEATQIISNSLLAEPDLLSSTDQLYLAWVNERCAPEILPYFHEIIEEVSEMIEMQLQESQVSLSPQEGIKGAILQAEVDRLKFVLRSYLRTRIDKIERYALFYMKNFGEVFSQLAEHEIAHLQRYHALICGHLGRRILDPLPEELSDLDKTANATPQPNLNEGVFFKAKAFIAEFSIAHETIEIKPGSIFFMRYSLIKSLLLDNLIELI